MNNISAEELHAAADACGVLSQVFLAGNVDEYLTVVGANPTGFTTLFPRCAQALTGADEELVGGEILQAQMEYARLLCNGCAEALHPFESVYLGADHLLMQEPRDQVVDLYAEYGFAASTEPHLPEDHISFELAFLQLLAFRSADGDPQAQALMARFANEHPLRWLPAFCDDLKDAAETNFWLDCADMLRGVIRVL